ncbi:MAG: phage minor head protein [Solirubrobacterales bacterium]
MTTNPDKAAVRALIHKRAAIETYLERIEARLYKARFAVLAGLRRRAERDIERAAAASFRAVAARIDETRLARAIRSGDIDAAIAEIPIQEVLGARFRADVGREVRETVTASGNRATQLLRQRLIRKDVDYRVRVESMRFDVLNEAVLEAMREHGAELVTEITDSTEVALRQLLAQMLEDGVPTTSQVKRIQSVVGLHSRHVQAVENLRAKLEALGKSPKFIERRAAAKARQLHRLRAQSIARFESGWSTGQGQVQAWKQARDEGIVTAQAKKVWRDAGDELVRDEHSEMNGVKVGLDEDFVLPDGTVIAHGPTDPGCRCGVDIEP